MTELLAGNGARNMITHKKDELIGLSWGEYSDYSFNGLYRVKQDLDLAECARRYYDEAPVCEWDEKRKEASDSGFGAWLLKNGLVDELAYDEVHCGCYGNFELCDVIATANTRGAALASN